MQVPTISFQRQGATSDFRTSIELGLRLSSELFVVLLCFSTSNPDCSNRLADIAESESYLKIWCLHCCTSPSKAEQQLQCYPPEDMPEG